MGGLSSQLCGGCLHDYIVWPSPTLDLGLGPDLDWTGFGTWELDQGLTIFYKGNGFWDSQFFSLFKLEHRNYIGQSINYQITYSGKNPKTFVLCEEEAGDQV